MSRKPRHYALRCQSHAVVRQDNRVPSERRNSRTNLGYIDRVKLTIPKMREGDGNQQKIASDIIQTAKASAPTSTSRSGFPVGSIPNNMAMTRTFCWSMESQRSEHNVIIQLPYNRRFHGSVPLANLAS